MFALSLSWALAVSYVDLTQYRIYNHLLALGITLVWPTLYLLGAGATFSRATVIFCSVALATGLSSLIGMGDAKLLLLFAPWLQYENLGYAALLLLGISWFQLLFDLLRFRRLSRRIAFAPAILVSAILNMAT